jgi:hypothetical protein
MGFRFRKSIKVLPGIRLNVGKNGINSVSVGGRGATTNIGKHGAHTTYSIPGTGISYRTGSHKSGSQGGGLGCFGLFFFGLVVLVFFGAFTRHEDNSPGATTAEPPPATSVESSPTPVAPLVDKGSAIEDDASETTPTSSVHRVLQPPRGRARVPAMEALFEGQPFDLTRVSTFQGPERSPFRTSPSFQ